ncbi:MAG: dephospho-CoA kinase [Gallionella sp.]|nr:dephospho-CoA kinase [Gallionella sp.]MDD4957787.1 dephospho-CoA kinase [Gallionella sp.]
MPALCIGLTGGIGSGKSTVARLFSDLGAGIVDADLIAHELTRTDGAAIPLIAAQFGNDYLNVEGALNREKMRTLIFSDPIAKQALEGILHPLIFSEARRQLVAYASPPYTLLVVPLLFEQPLFQSLVQRILVVDCPEALQIQRTMQRSQLSEAEVQAIIAQQMPRAERIRLADALIDNTTGMEQLENAVKYQHKVYVTLAQKNKH